MEEGYGSIPEYYKLYLEYMGEEAGNFQAATDTSYSKLNRIGVGTLELMQENSMEPPSGIFTFLMHQGYSVLFFVDRDVADPEIYVYTEHREIRALDKTFSSYLEAAFCNYLKRHSKES